MTPISLEKGDTIAVIAPAKQIEKSYIDNAVLAIERRGYQALVSKHCLGSNHYFSGTVAERLADFQWALDHATVKAIVCARGGYGSIQLLDQIDWTSFLAVPKWISGFSDITVFHQYLAQQGVASIHGTMPLNFAENSTASLDSLFAALEGVPMNYQWESKVPNQVGNVQGEIIGGNLTVLCGMIGTRYQPDFKDKILFIEDVGEALYAIDRNLYQLKFAGILDQLKGVVVGDFSGIKDTAPAYHLDLHTVVSAHFQERDIPICFDFPGGHCADNRAIIFGQQATLTVYRNTAHLAFNSPALHS